MTNDLNQIAVDALRRKQEAGNLRSLQEVEPLGDALIRINGKTLINFCGNSYLGLHQHPRIKRAAQEAIERYGTGSGASALVTGFMPVHDRAQRQIATWKGTESAILTPSGYQANVAAVQTVSALAREAKRPVRFLLDKLVHASVIDAVRSTGEALRVFPHNHLGKLARLLESGSGALEVVITESIFSMDGDAADLVGLARLKRQHPFRLMVDEAHASGVYGEHGAGLVRELNETAGWGCPPSDVANSVGEYAQPTKDGRDLGLGEAVDVSIITLSKALGGAGGAICASEAFCQAVANFGRALIYSTGLPASAAASAIAAIEVLQAEPEKAMRVRALALRVRGAWRAAGLSVPDGDSPIIPVIVGSSERALAVSEKLGQLGLHVAPIRPPTVAAGKSRLRVTLSSTHTDEQVERLIAGVIGSMASFAAGTVGDQYEGTAGGNTHVKKMVGRAVQGAG